MIPCLGQFYFQQIRKGRMTIIAMDPVPEYIKGEAGQEDGWRKDGEAVGREARSQK